MTAGKIARMLCWALVILYALKTVRDMGLAAGMGHWWFVPVGLLLIGIVYWSTRRIMPSDASARSTRIAAIDDWPYPPCWNCGAHVTSDEHCAKCKADQHIVRLFCKVRNVSADLPKLFPSFESCIHCLTYGAPVREFWFRFGEPRARRGDWSDIIIARCCDPCWRDHVRSVRLWSMLNPIATFPLGALALGGIVLAGGGIVAFFKDEALEIAAGALTGGVAAAVLAGDLLHRCEVGMRKRMLRMCVFASGREKGFFKFDLWLKTRATAERLRHMQQQDDVEAADVAAVETKPLESMTKKWILDRNAGILRNSATGESIPLRDCARVTTTPSGYEIKGPYTPAWINDHEIEIMR